MRTPSSKNLIAAVETIAKKPPVIPPPPKPDVKPEPLQVNAKPQRDFERAYVLKVTPEYRVGRSRLILELVSTKDKNKMPNIRIKPGMIIKITNMSQTLEEMQKEIEERRDAKK